MTNLSEFHPHCPYDGFKMFEIGSESHPKVDFITYECPHCTHKSVVAFFDGTGEFKQRSMVLCMCKGCRAVRAKTNTEFL